MRRGGWGLVRRGLLALVGCLVVMSGALSVAQAESAREACKAEGDKLRPSNSAMVMIPLSPGAIAGAIIGTAIGNAVGHAITQPGRDERADKRERECLSAKGLVPLKRQDASKAAATPQRASVSGAVRSGTRCACPQMTTCTGTWATLTCSQLTDRCRNPRTPMMYTVNGCDRLKQLVGGF